MSSNKNVWKKGLLFYYKYIMIIIITYKQMVYVLSCMTDSTEYLNPNHKFIEASNCNITYLKVYNKTRCLDDVTV